MTFINVFAALCQYDIKVIYFNMVKNLIIKRWINKK